MNVTRSLRNLALTVTVAMPAAADVVTVTPSKDNTLCESAGGTLSNGAGEYFFAGRTDNGDIRRGLLAFDLSAIPPGAIINSVSLQLNMSRTIAGNENVTLHRVNADWGQGTSDAPSREGECATATPGDATWLHAFSAATNWATSGGDFVAVASATTSVGGTGPYTWTSAQMATDVQLWVDSSAQNFGWLVRGNEAAATTAKRFDSRERAGGTGIPRLTVDYTVGTSAPGLYEFDTPGLCTIIAPTNSIGSGMSPLPLTPPGVSPLQFYQVDLDGDCMTAGPAMLSIVKGAGSELVYHFN